MLQKYKIFSKGTPFYSIIKYKMAEKQRSTAQFAAILYKFCMLWIVCVEMA